MNKEDQEKATKEAITSEALYIDFDENVDATLGWDNVKELVLLNNRDTN